MWADIIVPRGIENKVAISMVVRHIQRSLSEKSRKHQADLLRLGKQAAEEPLSAHVRLLELKPQIKAMDKILKDPQNKYVEFQFYMERLSYLLVEK